MDPVAVAPDATEKSLIEALNAHRRHTGKSALKLSPRLSQLAHTESVGAAAIPQVGKKSTDQVRRLSGFNSVSVANGVLKDRGPQTGANFIEYWKKDSAETLSNDWTHVGVGISKSADGRLFAVMILGGSQFATGASLMSPALLP